MDILENFKLTGKTIIVTGGGQNIGKSIALGFAEAGADIAIIDIDIDSANKVAEEITKMGRKSIAIKTDVSKLNDVQKMVAEVLNKFHKIDVLVNNASIFGKMLPIKDITEEDWDRTISIILKGTFLCSREVGKVMITQRSGKIINMGSITAMRAPRREYMSDFAAAKAGVIQFTRCLAAEWGKYGINVNSISPGYHETDSAITHQSDESRKTLISYTPLQKTAVANDMKPVALFLASDSSNYITGHNLVTDGGRICWYD